MVKKNRISVPNPNKKTNYFPKRNHDAGELTPGMNIQQKFRVTIGPPITAIKLKQSVTVHDFFKGSSEN